MANLAVLARRIAARGRHLIVTSGTLVKLRLDQPEATDGDDELGARVDPERSINPLRMRPNRPFAHAELSRDFFTGEPRSGEQVGHFTLATRQVTTLRWLVRRSGVIARHDIASPTSIHGTTTL